MIHLQHLGDEFSGDQAFLARHLHVRIYERSTGASLVDYDLYEETWSNGLKEVIYTGA